MKYWRCKEASDGSYKMIGYNSLGINALKRELLDYIKEGDMEDFTYVLDNPNVNTYKLTDLVQMLDFMLESSDTPFEEIESFF